MKKFILLILMAVLCGCAATALAGEQELAWRDVDSSPENLQKDWQAQLKERRDARISELSEKISKFKKTFSEIVVQAKKDELVDPEFQKLKLITEKEIQKVETIKSALEKRKIFIGMTGADVKISWREPFKTNRDVSSSGLFEQWIFYEYQDRPTYVYLHDGIVTGWQQFNK